MKEPLPPASNTPTSPSRRFRRSALIILDDMENTIKLERCGYCGRYFRGLEFCTTNELNNIAELELNNAPLGYCPEAQQEHYEQNPEDSHHQVTRDMAIDACDPSLEGQWI